MITAREIVAWRAQADWNSDLMVEQDYLLSQAVQAIFEDPFLRTQVAMRGGTVLHKGHLAPAVRYSEDIDLVLVGDRPANHIKKALARVLQPILGNPTESILTEIQLAVRNLVAKSQIIRLTYTYDPYSQDAALAHLKIEANVSERESLYPLTAVDIVVPGTTKAVSVVSYDLDEMLGTKLRALLQREQGRDLFDLWWAWETAMASATVKVDPTRVAAAFRFYMEQEGSFFGAAGVRQELDRRMQSRKFLADMDGFLANRLTYSPTSAYNTFCGVFLPCLGE